jgi:hypothetical protein
MFIFHHVNAFQVSGAAPGSSNGSNGSSSNSSGSTGAGRQLLVLDTVGWDRISFESTQHNLTKDYYKGEPGWLGWLGWLRARTYLVHLMELCQQ